MWILAKYLFTKQQLWVTSLPCQGWNELSHPLSHLPSLLTSSWFFSAFVPGPLSEACTRTLSPSVPLPPRAPRMTHLCLQLPKSTQCGNVPPNALWQDICDAVAVGAVIYRHQILTGGKQHAWVESHESDGSQHNHPATGARSQPPGHKCGWPLTSLLYLIIMAIPQGQQGDVQSSYLTDEQTHPPSKELAEGHMANLYPRSLGIQPFWPLCHWPSPNA